MATDLALRRKLTFRAPATSGLGQIVLVKKRDESIEHVLMKAFLWALYLPAYPHLAVEVPIGDRYKPDLVALDPAGRPQFWGEAGKVGKAKYRSLARRFPDTHFAVAKWGGSLAPHQTLIEKALTGFTRRAAFDLISFPPDAAERFVEDGTIRIAFGDLEILQLGRVNE